MSIEQFRDVNIIVDTANYREYRNIFVSQGDYDGRSLTVQITDNGLVKEQPGLQVNLWWKHKVAGNQGLDNFTLINKEESIFKIDFPNVMLTPGTVIVALQILIDGRIIMTREFEIDVQKLYGSAYAVIKENSFSTLTNALAESNKWLSELEKKPDLETIKDMISELPTGSPKETFTSLAALKQKYPSGNESAMLVLDASGAGYVYTWNGTDWVKGPLYQAAGIADGSVDEKKAAPILLNGSIVSQNFKIDLQNKKITLPPGITWVIGKSNKNYSLPSQEFLIERTNGYLVYDTLNKKITLRELQSTLQTDIVFGVIWVGDVLNIDNVSDTILVKSDGTEEKISNAILSDANQRSTLILSGNQATEARVTKTATSMNLVISGGITITNPLTKRARVHTEKIEIDINELNGAAGVVLYNDKERSFSVLKQANIPSLPAFTQLFAMFWNDGSYFLVNSTIPCFLNGRILSIPHFGETGELSIAEGQLFIDKTNKTVEILGTNSSVKSVFRYGNEIRYNPDFDISNYVEGKPTIFYYDYALNAIKIAQYETESINNIPPRSAFCGMAWGGLTNMDFNTNTDVFVDKKLIQKSKNAVSTTYQYCAIGDSLTEGLKSYADAENPATFYEQPYPFWISKEYGGALTNIGKSSGRFGGDRNIDFQGQVDSVKFSNFGFVTIALGVNDWQNNISKETIQTAMRKGIDKILTDNSKIHIAGILPQNTVRNSFSEPPNIVDDGFTRANGNGDTLSDVCDYIKEVYDEYRIPCFDFRKSPILLIRNKGLYDWDGIHLNQAGHKLQGRRIAEWLKINV